MRLLPLWLLALGLMSPARGAARAHGRPAPPSPACDVLAAALAAVFGTTEGLQIVGHAETPWPAFRHLPTERQAAAVSALRTRLPAPDSLVDSLVAAGRRQVELPRCDKALRNIRWLREAPAEASDTTVVALSWPVFTRRGDQALLYVGRSNRWVGGGVVYLLDRSSGHWAVARSADVWIQ